MKIITETERLIIREIEISDTDVMLELHSDPIVHRYLGNKTITSREGIIDAINSLRKQYADFGVGRWAMIHKKTGEFIGWTGLEFVTKPINNHKNYYDLGYRLLRKFWGQGFATESAFASIDYVFNKLGAAEIYAMADIDNVGSNMILKNVGLRFIESFDNEGVKHNWYRLTSSEYESKKYKSAILDKICYTDLVYGRINKKLNIQLSKDKIEEMIFTIINETDYSGFYKKGKNIYIRNNYRNVRLTINSYTNRIITADRLNKKTTK
jgi:[ribosomal protein S5]-alanine N-acetyltransferase